jgi:hypothetical protein
VLFSSFWIYELGNLAALHLAGRSPHLVVQGYLPAGVISSAPPNALLGKPFQLVLGVGVFTPILWILWVLWRKRSPFTKIALLFCLSSFISSVSWEAQIGFPINGLAPLLVYSMSTVGVFELLFNQSPQSGLSNVAGHRAGLSCQAYRLLACPCIISPVLSRSSPRDA